MTQTMVFSLVSLKTLFNFQGRYMVPTALEKKTGQNGIFGAIFGSFILRDGTI